MRKGFSLAELGITITVVGTLAAFAIPRFGRLLDSIAADQAAREITTALAVGRHSAVMHATRARVTIASDSLRIDRLEKNGWAPVLRQPGPVHLGVSLEISNPVIVFGPTGIGWGVSNTRIVLRRQSQVETITVSRLGRVKRW